MDEINKRNGVINKGTPQLSASLKERLKRCGRYYSSPMTTKTPKPDTGFLPTPDSSSSSSSLNTSYPTLTLDSPIYETPTSAILTPLSSEDQRDSHFDDSLSLSSTPVLKVKDSQGSHPRVKRLRLSSRACFNDQSLPGNVQEEGDKELPQQEILNTSILEDSLLISECGDSQSSKKDQSVVLGMCSQSGDGTQNLVGHGDLPAEVVPETLSCEELVARKLKLQNQLKEKEECLRKLRMVKLYRSKNDLASLDELIHKWRGVSQQVLLDLHQKLPEPKPLLSELLQHWNIDLEFLRLNPEDETFY